MIRYLEFNRKKYYSLTDIVADLELTIPLKKNEAQAFGWACREMVAKKMYDAIKKGEVADWHEPIIPSFSDYFVSWTNWHSLFELLPSKHYQHPRRKLLDHLIDNGEMHIAEFDQHFVCVHQPIGKYR